MPKPLIVALYCRLIIKRKSFTGCRLQSVQKVGLIKNSLLSIVLNWLVRFIILSGKNILKRGSSVIICLVISIVFLKIGVE